jgi:hypothetical protein
MSDVKSEAKVEKISKGDPDAEAAPPAPDVKRAVEKIAFERGMLPEFKAATPPAHRPGAKLPPVHNEKFAIFARAQIVNNWPIGFELTGKEFDAAVAASEKLSVYR